MRSAFSIAVLIAQVLACSPSRPSNQAPPAVEAGSASNLAPTHTAEASSVTEPRFLLVTLNRIQIIDRHPEYGDEPPENATTPRYVLPNYGARPAGFSPEIHSYEDSFAVPEFGIMTFEITLNEKLDYRLLFVTRGWTVGPDGKIQLDGQATTNWSIQHSLGGGEGPNPWSVEHTPLTPDAWHGFDVMRARDRHFVYYELQEVRFGPITARPPGRAVIGRPDSLSNQRQKDIDWSLRAPRIVLP